MTCEHCGNTGHTGNSCPENGSEDVNFVTTMASATGLVLNQVGTHDPTYLSLVKVCLLAVLSSLIKILLIKKL